MEKEKKNISENSPKFRLPLRAYLTYILVATFLVTGVTYSKYVTRATGGDAARVMKMGDVTITETGDFYEDYGLRIIPGVDLEKKAVVTFEGSEATCYVFLEVYAENWSTADNIEFIDEVNSKITWKMSDEWMYLSSDGDKHIYYMIVEPNVNLDKEIINQNVVCVSEELTNSEIKKYDATSLNIKFQAIAVQYDGFGDSLSEGYTKEQHAQVAYNTVK